MANVYPVSSQSGVVSHQGQIPISLLLPSNAKMISMTTVTPSYSFSPATHGYDTQDSHALQQVHPYQNMNPIMTSSYSLQAQQSAKWFGIHFIKSLEMLQKLIDAFELINSLRPKGMIVKKKKNAENEMFILENPTSSASPVDLWAVRSLLSSLSTSSLSSVTPPYTTSHHIFLLPISPLFYINRYFYLFYLTLSDVYEPLHTLPTTILERSEPSVFRMSVSNTHSSSNTSQTTSSFGVTPLPLQFGNNDTSPEVEMAHLPWLEKPMGL
jgi:hypothetical protein